MEYFFYGFESVVNGTALTYWGQIVDMPQATAEKAVLDSPRAMLLPKDLADEIDFTAADLATCRTAASHASAPLEFLEKKAALNVKVDEYLERLKNKESGGGVNTEHEGQR